MHALFHLRKFDLQLIQLLVLLLYNILFLLLIGDQLRPGLAQVMKFLLSLAHLLNNLLHFTGVCKLRLDKLSFQRLLDP